MRIKREKCLINISISPIVQVCSVFKIFLKARYLLTASRIGKSGGGKFKSLMHLSTFASSKILLFEIEANEQMQRKKKRDTFFFFYFFFFFAPVFFIIFPWSESTSTICFLQYLPPPSPSFCPPFLIYSSFLFYANVYP